MPGRTFFPNLSKTHYFGSDPISVDPIRPQPNNGSTPSSAAPGPAAPGLLVSSDEWRGHQGAPVGGAPRWGAKKEPDLRSHVHGPHTCTARSAFVLLPSVASVMSGPHGCICGLGARVCSALPLLGTSNPPLLRPFHCMPFLRLATRRLRASAMA